MNSIRVGESLLDLTLPKVMGILNVTPDSFYDGGRFQNLEAAVSQVDLLIEDGATIIDIGAFSSRPGAKMISEQEEIDRLLPIVEEINKNYPKLIISIDTYRSEVVKAVAQVRPFIVNDITGFEKDDNLLETISKLDLPYILMHMQGMPSNMQDKPEYDNVIMSILDFFSLKISQLRQSGIQQILIDPGFGFGKTLDHNYRILKKLKVFQLHELPVLVGLSRKSMIYKPLQISPENALNGTTALHMLALNNGAKIIRAHDVKEAVQTVKLYSLLTEA